MLKKQYGFSLIEIMIVIVIIAILVAMALPSYQKYTKRAHYMEIIQAAAPLKLAVTECFEINGTLRDCKSGNNSIPEKQYSQGSLIYSIEVLTNGIIYIKPNNKYGIYSKDDYYLTPTISSTSILWQSSGGGVTAGYAK
jgi:type IV pilus assembly protein PilA